MTSQVQAMMGGEEIVDGKLVKVIGSLARELSQTIAVAESATGGMISSLLVDPSGSSDYFRGGVVAYHNDIKERVLGVRAETLDSVGAVSQETAAEMAEGVRRVFGADIGVSDTGIAGPTGATPGKPVGLFYIGLATAEGAKTERHLFEGTRTQKRRRAAEAVLILLRDCLLEIRGSIVDEKHVVTCFLERAGKVCLLRRSHAVGTYKGRWAGVSGYIEEDKSPLEQAFMEMEEEASLAEGDVELVKAGDTVAAIDRELGRKWIIHPYRFRIAEVAHINIDWEHSELAWIDPRDMRKYETVPKLWEAWQRVSLP